MVEFIIEYWLEVAFGIVVTIMGLFIRHYKKLYDSQEKNKEEKLWLNINKAIKEDHQQTLNEVWARGDKFEADRQ